ncbi:MAG: hypothetical protein ACQETI_13200 [Halobacteriota archaeon]
MASEDARAGGTDADTDSDARPDRPDTGTVTGERPRRAGDDDRIDYGEPLADAPRSSSPPSLPRSRLLSRVLVTWFELTLVGLTGTLLGATVGGPPGFLIYLATTLVTVGVLFYNVNELLKQWLRTTDATS